jgi:class 3 adenylate cyclase
MENRPLRLITSSPVDALGVVGSMASGIIEYLAEGAWTKRMHPGWAAQSGIRAADLARAGFIGPRTVFEGTHGLFFGFAHTTEGDWGKLLDGFGTRWVANDLAFKPYACGTMTQPYVDCARRISTRVSLDEIEELWGTGARLDVFAPRAAQDERFRRWYARYERLSLSPRMLRAVVASDFEKDLRGVLPAIRVPTLVLHRAGNRFIDIRRGRYLAEHIAGAKFVEIPGDDHLFHLGETEIILNEIEEFLTGERPVPEIDRVLATVLFTDIVGSTERAAVLGDHAWRSLLDAHHDVARRALERHRGREVEFVGDGLLATFDGPARAIRCACAIAEDVRALGIEIRAGLHTGEIELAGRAVRGIAVHIGARVAAQAGPSEVLVSSTVKDLVAGSGLRFVDCGVRALKGVPDEWRLFRVEPRAV